LVGGPQILQADRQTDRPADSHRGRRMNISKFLGASKKKKEVDDQEILKEDKR
jgi:hypothetical protein